MKDATQDRGIMNEIEEKEKQNIMEDESIRKEVEDKDSAMTHNSEEEMTQSMNNVYNEVTNKDGSQNNFGMKTKEDFD